MAPSVVSLLLPVLLILCAMLLPSSSASGSDNMLMLDRFHRWMSAHGRSYPSADEKLRRLEVYRQNVELIEATNRESERLGYELGENEFTDLTNEEFVARYTGGAVPDDAIPADGMGSSIITTLAGDVDEGHAWTVDLNASSAEAPEKFDWREKGAVTRAKSQGSCGCCWAFSTVAAVESLNKIKGGQLYDLSVQEVLDCDVSYQEGCKGGYPGKALQWIQAQGGVVAQAEYPYQARQGQCRTTDSARRIGKITGVKGPLRGGEPQLKLAVHERPVVVSIDGKGALLQHYKDGIYKGPCTTNLSHAVVLIGYGVTSGGVEYWTVKNSWGESWGRNGFFYMRRGADGEAGLCGVALRGVFPV